MQTFEVWGHPIYAALAMIIAFALLALMMVVGA